MLGGHLDDMEADWSKPIVSMRYVGNSFFGCILHVFLKKIVRCLLILARSVWDARLFSFWEEKVGRIRHLLCFSEVVMLCSWLEKQGSVFMVNVNFWL